MDTQQKPFSKEKTLGKKIPLWIDFVKTCLLSRHTARAIKTDSTGLRGKTPMP
jgi:hypothetical protein